MNLFEKLVIKEFNVFFNHSHRSPDKKPRVIWTIKYLGAILTFKGANMLFKLPDNRKASLSISYEDALGVPTTVDGNTAWTSSDPSIATVEASEDGTTVTVKPASPVKIGTTQISAVADADLGEGVTELTSLLDVEVIPSSAVTAAITAVLVEEPAA